VEKMSNQYYITVVILANGKSEEEVIEGIEKQLEGLVCNQTSGHKPIIEDCWIESIEEDNQ
jgi:hypothetical protein